MMGEGHALSGAAVWVMGCAIADQAGLHPSFTAVVVGGGVCAGFSLWPDMDHPHSTLAHSAGLVTRAIARAVGIFGAWVHACTRTRWDRVDLDGHRTVTHTAAWALLWGGLAMFGQQYGPRWIAAALVLPSAVNGLKLVLPKKLRTFRVRTGFRGRWLPRRMRVSVPLTAALLMAFAAFQMTVERGWWLGVAVATGSLVHCLGDCLTNSACPMLWPLPIGRAGRRRLWYPVGPPAALRFSAGGLVERRVVYPMLWLWLGVGVLLLVWPQA